MEMAESEWCLQGLGALENGKMELPLIWEDC